MKVDLKDRIAVVTGAAGAIGHSTALMLAENGATVAVNDLHDPEATCAEIRERGGKARGYAADVSDVSSVNSMISAIESDLGPIDIMVNNAGINVGKNRVPDFMNSLMQTGTRLSASTSMASSSAPAQCRPGMIARRKGTIINITSVFGIVPARMQCAYTAAKAGVANFTRSHALEVGQYGIRVNGVAPGSILTEGTRVHVLQPGEQAERQHAQPYSAGRAGRDRGHRSGGALPRLRRCEVCHRPYPGGRWWLDRGLSSRLVK